MSVGTLFNSLTVMVTAQSSSDSEADDEDDDDPRVVNELTNGSLKFVSINRLEQYFELTIVLRTNQEFITWER